MKRTSLRESLLSLPCSRHQRCGRLVFAAFLSALAFAGRVALASEFRAGATQVDVTPPVGLPMWGYGGRKDIPARKVRDPLYADVVVLSVKNDFGVTRLALVGLHMGRPPARASMSAIYERAREAGVDHVFVVGSHTHHGPCLELERSEPTAGYIRDLVRKIGGGIERAVRDALPARISFATKTLDRNRNRHTKIEPKPVDRDLRIMHVTKADGSATIATVVNYSAHPTSIPAIRLEYSADYVGALKEEVRRELGGVCVFLQGAVGDMSCQRRGAEYDEFGRILAREVVGLARSQPQGRALASIVGSREEFRFTSRVRIEEPLTYLKYCLAFFKDLVDAYVEEYREGVRPQLGVVLLGEEVGVVAASGEFFAAHAIRLRARARLEHLFFLGPANGYHQYFPTIEAVAEGGYGADETVSPVEVGAGETLMNRALVLLYELRRRVREASRQRDG
ncbi:MAG: hypothetical protein AAF517_01935 [Planctomycetota bacterium]